MVALTERYCWLPIQSVKGSKSFQAQLNVDGGDGIVV